MSPLSPPGDQGSNEPVPLHQHATGDSPPLDLQSQETDLYLAGRCDFRLIGDVDGLRARAAGLNRMLRHLLPAARR